MGLMEAGLIYCFQGSAKHVGLLMQARNSTVWLAYLETSARAAVIKSDAIANTKIVRRKESVSEERAIVTCNVIAVW